MLGRSVRGSRVVRTLVFAALLVSLVGLGAVSPARASHPAPPGLDHFKCYDAVGIATDPYEFPRGIIATLTDQFGSFTTDLNKAPNRLCNPVQKRLPTGQVFAPQNPAAHLVCFSIFNTTTFQPKRVQVQNQFGVAMLEVVKPTKLCVPTWKNFTGQFPTVEQPPGLDHFLCYDVKYLPGTAPFGEIPPSVKLKDQFLTNTSNVFAPKELCNPVEKRIGAAHVAPITNPQAHLVCFKINHPAFTPLKPFTQNQFGRARIKAVLPNQLCLPSFKQVLP